jgi:predicted permease
MKTLTLDLRYSLRMLRKDFAHTAIVILLFALGIGANTAIFSVANSVLLKPLPYAHPDRLVVALHQGNAPVSPADYLDYRRSVPAFDQLGAAQVWGANLTSGERPEQIPGIRISANLIGLLGVRPLLGRAFTPVEEHAGASNVLLLSYNLWRDRFGAEKSIIGRQVSLDHVSYTVVGVMPPSFRFAPFWATRAQMWTPLVLDDRLNDRGGRSLRLFGRLRPGVSLARAQSQMDAVAAHLAKLYPATNAKLGISLVPLREKVVRAVRPTLFVLLGTVGFVLLIACATVGNLLLARAVTRRKEMALRVAVGAQRADLVRIALTEALLLAVCGGAAGALLASTSVNLFRNLLPPASLPRQSELGIDLVALLFACAITVLSALCAGFIPALQALRADLNTGLKEGSHGTGSSPGGSRTRSFLIAAEVALSLVLMAGAGLMLRTMYALGSVDAGFQPAHILSMQISVSGTGYDRAARRASLFRETTQHLAALPGVESVSAINHLPLGGDLWNLDYTIEGRPAPAPGDQISAIYRVTLPGYFRTMQIGLLRGRDFNAYDKEGASPVAIINEAMAKRRWPGANPLGQIIRYGITPQDLAQPRTIVGVVSNARQNDWTAPPADEIYLPYYQRPDSMGLSYLTFILRTRGNPDDSASAILDAVHTFNPSLPVSEMVSMPRVISDELWRQRLATLLIGAFAVLAMLLSAVGIYGVIAHSIRQRTREIGVRLALGAPASHVVGLALRQGLRPVVLGACAGFAAALLLTRFLRTLLYGVTPNDPATFIGIVAILLVVCVVANLIPALRSTRIDPLLALRQD